MPFTIGCDPEIFITHGGKGICANGLIPGTKEKPHPTANGAVQVDGMALELNTTPVDIGDFEGFNQNVVKQIGCLRDMVNEGNTGERIGISIKPVMDFDPEVMAAAPEEAKELGCDPDYSAYTMAPNPRPEGSVNFRTGAGHLHIGWGADIPLDNPEHMAICAGFVKACDYTVGMFMTVIDREPRRRQLYGKAGAFRPKSYGVEYRTPSNVWIKNRETRAIVHHLLNKAVKYHSAGYTPEKLFPYHAADGTAVTQEEIQRIIDEGDAVRATIICDAMMVGYSVWAKNKESLINDAGKLAA